MRVEGMTPERDKFLIEHSRWYNRVFKSKEEIQNMPDHGGDEWQYGWYKYGGRAPIFTQYFIGKGITRIFQDCMLAFHSSGALGDSDTEPYSTEWLINTNGKEGESYQDAFDACFCEEMFVPLVPELEGGWISVTPETIFEGFDSEGEMVKDRPTFWRAVKAIVPEPKEVPYGWIPYSDVKKPYDGATCDFCYGREQIENMEWQTAKYREWISHPGGEATTNAGPGFVDEHGFPAYEEPLWWRYYQEPIPQMNYAKVVAVDEAPKWIDPETQKLSASQYPRTPDECYPPGSKLTSSEDEDYYATI